MRPPPLRTFVVDSFTNQPFSGNPAGVCLIPKDYAPIDDRTLLNIAAELRHSETAFVWPPSSSAETCTIRWFSPTKEVDLCGHATLAAAWVLLSRELGMDSGVYGINATVRGMICDEKIVFSAPLRGIELTVRVSDSGMLTMSFPSYPPEPIPDPQNIFYQCAESIWRTWALPKVQ